jgi:hypothetical protein
MKLLNIKLLFASLLLFNVSLFGEEKAKKRSFWIPKNVTLQHAGSIGYFSAGFGYNLNKSGKSTLDFMYGNVPESKGGDLNIFTTKFAWRPFNIPIKDWAIIHPINPGIFISYHRGKNFDSKWDDVNYPKGYYWWSTAIRPHISFTTEVKIDAKKILKNTKIKHISFYNEINTNELYFISYIQNNRTLSLTQVFKLGLGAKVYF